MSHRERRHLRIDELPGEPERSARRAREGRRSCSETLGEHIFEHFLEAKRNEWDDYIGTSAAGRSALPRRCIGRLPGRFPCKMGREAWRAIATDHFDIDQAAVLQPVGPGRSRPPGPAEVVDDGDAGAVAARGDEPAVSRAARRGARGSGRRHDDRPLHGVLVRVDGFSLLTDPHSRRTPGRSAASARRACVRPASSRATCRRSMRSSSATTTTTTSTSPSLRWLTAQRAPAFVTCLGLKRPLERKGIGPVIELDWWESTDVIGAEITATPALHWSNRTMFDRRTDALGRLHAPRARRAAIYFAGDSGYAPFFDAIRERLGGARHRAAADRRLRAALVHAAVPHDPGGSRTRAPRGRRQGVDRHAPQLLPPRRRRLRELRCVCWRTRGRPPACRPTTFRVLDVGETAVLGG